MILKAKHHFFIYPFFQKYTLWKIRRNFADVVLVGDDFDNQNSILLLSNHSGWWDGFFSMYLNLKILKKKFHFMMLEENLKKFWFFNYTGAFSVAKNSKSIIESINYTLDLLEDNNNMVLIFPQGKIHSQHNQFVKFESGVLKILSNLKTETNLVFQVNLIDYFSNPKPTLHVFYKYLNSNEIDCQKIEKSYNLFYQECLSTQINTPN